MNEPPRQNVSVVTATKGPPKETPSGKDSRSVLSNWKNTKSQGDLAEIAQGQRLNDESYGMHTREGMFLRDVLRETATALYVGPAAQEMSWQMLSARRIYPDKARTPIMIAWSLGGQRQPVQWHRFARVHRACA